MSKQEPHAARINFRYKTLKKIYQVTSYVMTKGNNYTCIFFIKLKMKINKLLKDISRYI